ncbi:MAG: hypothetical protein KGL62_04550, partial [Bradyrhizobium sp.]|uniref:hypothetical protein n=1 Tax=Bradyrhizobium sp. TaxID=376 RepID=UPI00238AC124
MAALARPAGAASAPSLADRQAGPHGVKNRGRDAISLSDSAAIARLFGVWAVACSASIRRVSEKPGFREIMTIRLHRGDL